MAIIKCKMCGGDLNLIEGASTAECEYCGSMQTVPKVDDEKKLTLFARANRLRASCEFDKAAGIYEAIVADFPEEAEAYWGLVLCKYGIEYVDDSATGKKIPTCHRSSFASIMDDGDFEQALENADPIARKVYREEAKQIEEIRKGIIAVSSNEQPYDIFICYKETNEEGDRTLDSVLAQDLYDALTAKNYRVFFARITLEDKLGVEYEPYIFAALNSAKIMLAVGTDYEYYNAVWVKNEWSRYLKLMAKDKDKHLIPCYKGIDAYDMPKEFSKLQAQDLGKVGATQDLLRGIEKILPKQKNTTVIQERVVVGGGGDNKIASLLDRGNMALEDGDWDKADSFFEDVLNNDSKNAQAYLGKTLAVEKCRTLDALVRKLKDARQNAQSHLFFLQEDNAHIDEAVQQYSIKGYVNSDRIRKMYYFDLSYPSTVESRKQQRKDAESWWKNHKWLSRAEKFAAGELAQILKQAYNDLFSALDARLTRAKQEEAAAQEKQQARYAAHLEQADQHAREAYENGAAIRENDYKDACWDTEKTTDIHRLNRAKETLHSLSGYKDSDAKYAECQKKIQEITANRQAAEAAEKERKRAAEEAQATRSARIKTLKRTCISVVIAATAIFLVLLFTRIIPGNQYDEAVQLLQTGKYKQAFDTFIKIKHFEDSLDQAYACADALATNGDYDSAIDAFTKLGEHKDSAMKVLAVNYEKAEHLLSEGDLANAAFAFGAAKDYSDAAQKKDELWAQITTRETISGNTYMACIKTDGTVRIAGDGDEAYWSDVIAVSRGTGHTVGLKSNGTVVATGDNDRGQCNTSKWTDIVAISAGTWYTVGLKSDGTVVLAGQSIYDSVHTALKEVTKWTDIISIDAGEEYIIGLKADGTVLVAGEKLFDDVSISDIEKATEWTDIIAISAGPDHVVGLKADGTVVAVGSNKYGRCDVSEWTGITEICAGSNNTLGLKADGTVVAVGDDGYGKCSKVSEWSEIVTIAASSRQSAGVKADGTVIAVGDKYFDVYDDVYEWTDVKIPD